MLEECRQFSGLLRRHGFPEAALRWKSTGGKTFESRWEVPHRSVEGWDGQIGRMEAVDIWEMFP